MWGPRYKSFGLAKRIDRSRECRHRKQIESCRIGEAANPGPGLHDKRHKQCKLYDFFIRSQDQIDSKSEWCKALGFKVHNIKGDGNCLYTCLGKELEMTGNQ
eukprot:6343331-Heterocapsa_arctica.AAC.1